MNRLGWTLDDVAKWAKPWISWLADISAGTGATGETHLPRENPDAIPRNIIVSPAGELTVFDLEWKAPAALPVPYVVFRGLVATFRSVTSVAPPAGHVTRYIERHGIPHNRIPSIARDIQQRAGLVLTDSLFADFRRREMDFLAYALGNDLLNASRPRLVSAISVRRPAVEQIDLRGLILAVADRLREKVLGQVRIHRT